MDNKGSQLGPDNLFDAVNNSNVYWTVSHKNAAGKKAYVTFNPASTSDNLPMSETVGTYERLKFTPINLSSKSSCSCCRLL